MSRLQTDFSGAIWLLTATLLPFPKQHRYQAFELLFVQNVHSADDSFRSGARGSLVPQSRVAQPASDTRSAQVLGRQASRVNVLQVFQRCYQDNLQDRLLGRTLGHQLTQSTSRWRFDHASLRSARGRHHANGEVDLSRMARLHRPVC